MASPGPCAANQVVQEEEEEEEYMTINHHRPSLSDDYSSSRRHRHKKKTKSLVEEQQQRESLIDSMLQGAPKPIIIKMEPAVVSMSTTAAAVTAAATEEEMVVDWEAVRDDIVTLCEGPHADGTLAPALIRLAWHGAGTYDATSSPHGGTNGATMRFEPESGYAENRGLAQARAALSPVVSAHPGASHADVYVLASYVAIEHLGGPRIGFTPGRSDVKSGGPSVCPPEARLPRWDESADSLRVKFNRLGGLSDRAMVALIGAHTVGHTHEDASGFPQHKWDNTPLVFDNRYYEYLLRDWWILDEEDPDHPFYRNRSWLMLLSDWVLREDEKLKAIVEEFAQDEVSWKAEFARAFKQITELGLSSTVITTTTTTTTKRPTTSIVRRNKTSRTLGKSVKEEEEKKEKEEKEEKEEGKGVVLTDTDPTVTSVASVASAPSAPVIRTAQGAVRGICDSSSNICSFRGIPFAEPPVKELRFAPTVYPARPWPDVRDGTHFGPACYQTPEDDITTQSEDCLTLSVWTTTGSSNLTAAAGSSFAPQGAPRRPVIVFFYGGGALMGDNAWYNLSAFVRDGGVVIAANYRLGPLGFLSMRELSSSAVPEAADGASGNYGLWDCAAALHWARANAARFGGDATRITAMGQSSGASMVWGLMGRRWPAKTRPFEAAIILSGSPNMTMAPARAWAQNAPLARAVGCGNLSSDQETANCLRLNASAAAISYGHVPINTTWQEYGPQTWGIPDVAHARTGWPQPGIITVDGAFLVESLEEAISNGVNADVDLLVSNVGEECDLSPNHDFSSRNSSNTTTDFEEFVARRFAAWDTTTTTTTTTTAAAAASSFGRDLYARFFNTSVAPGGPQQAYTQMCATIGTACGQIHLLRVRARARARARTGRARTDLPAAGRTHYLSVIAGPSHAQELGVANWDGYLSRFAYHQFDLIWSQENWDWFANFTGVARRYKPSEDDRYQARMLRGIYLAVARGGESEKVVFGKGNNVNRQNLRQQHARGLVVDIRGPGHNIDDGSAAFSSSITLPPFGDADNYTVALAGKRSVVPGSGWRAPLCDHLKASGIWRTFWWVN